MKLQKQTSRKYKDKEYQKHWVIIPKKVIDELKWKSDELRAEIKGNKLIISEDKNENNSSTK